VSEGGLGWFAQYWPPVATAGGAGTIGVIITKWWEHQRRKRAQTDNVALDLVHTLTERVNKVEGDMLAERQVCEQRISALEAQAAQDRAEHANLDQLRRHQVQNMRHLFDLTIEMIELAQGDPDRISQIIVRVRARRVEQESAEALEKGAIAAGRFANIPAPPRLYVEQP
jgi:hypothetical protein